MTAMAWICVGAAVWLIVAVTLSLLLGRVIRRRDEQVPHSYSPRRSTCPDTDPGGTAQQAEREPERSGDRRRGQALSDAPVACSGFPLTRFLPHAPAIAASVACAGGGDRQLRSAHAPRLGDFWGGVFPPQGLAQLRRRGREGRPAVRDVLGVASCAVGSTHGFTGKLRRLRVRRDRSE